MPQASYLISSFLGGEIAPTAQGAMHDPLYKISLDTCQNYIPLEEHSLTRRTGLKFVAMTKAGGVARNWSFIDAQRAAYNVEAGGGYFRFYKNRSLILESTTKAVTSVSSDTPAIVHAVAHGLSTGNYIEFTSLVGGDILRNRQFIISKIDNDNFSISDPMSGLFVGTAVSGFVSGNVQRVYEITSPYDSGEIFSVYQLQDQNQQVMLHPSVAPTTLNRASGTDTFSTAIPAFIDGPYLDPPTDGSTLTPDAVVGTITLVASAITGINGGVGFVVTDVGRAVRLFSEPPAWSSGTTYAQGGLVKWQDNYWSSLKAGNTNHQPDLNLSWWALSPSSATWVWATISHFTNATTVVVTTQPFTDGSTPSLLNTNAIAKWQLGLYSNTTGWPSCGGFHEGRLWLSSPAQPNRMDASRPDIHFDFSPTSPDGTVADDNAVDITATSEDANPVLWFVSSLKGLLAGTAAGEWLISASQLDDPITPTSIQARRVTKFGCAAVRPAQTPSSLAVVHRPKRKIWEYKWFIDTSAYSVAPNAVAMSLRARHLMETGIDQVEYQADPYTVVWARRDDGLLVGATYQRNPQAFFTAWHKHPLGGGALNNNSNLPALVQSMTIVPTPDGLSEDLWCVIGRKITGILAPDATPNPPVQPTTTIIDPVTTLGGHDYHGDDRIIVDESTSQIFVTAQRTDSLNFAMAVFDLNGNFLRSAPIIVDGVQQADSGFNSPVFAIAPGGQYIIGMQNYYTLSRSLIFLLNKTTLAYVQSAIFGENVQQTIAVDPTETYVVAPDPYFFSAYHIPSGTVAFTRWDSMGATAPTAAMNDCSFDAAGNLWIGEVNGYLEKYTLSYDSLTHTITPTKVSTYLPHNDGTGIVKLTYNNSHNHMLLWYTAGGGNTPGGGTGSGRMTRFNLTSHTIYADFTYPYKQASPGLAGLPAWYAERQNFHDQVVYTDLDANLGGAGGPIIHFFNSTNGQSRQEFLQHWPKLAGHVGDASYFSTNTHTIFVNTIALDLLSYDVASFAADDIGLGDGTVHYIEFTTPLLDFAPGVTDPKLAFFADSGRQDSDDSAAVTVSGGNVIMTGLHYLEGETILVHANGVDQGNFQVFKGQVIFPAPSGVTMASQVSLSIGYPYDSIGKTLPEAEAGGANGPAAFKTRRNHKYALLLNQTQGISITEDDRNYMADELRDEVTNQPTQPPALFSGHGREDMGGGDYSYRGKVCWKQSRGYPGTILAIGGFIDVMDV